ncbi:MAG: hypothetical protein KC502_09305 [Myxococcales bacterium]|nr:hypothetical protein [Myxococcales bacterium]
MARSSTDRRQEGRYPALVAVLNRRREVFGLCDRELAERTRSRFGASKNVSQIHRILHGDSGTRQRYAEQLANVVDVGRHVARLLIEFEDDLLPLEFSDAPPTRAEADEVVEAYDLDEDMYALQGAVRLYERAMGHTDRTSLHVRAEMSLLIGKLVRLHGTYPGFIDDALRFVDDAMNLFLELEHGGEALIEESIVAAEIERATIYRRRGHLDMALRVLNESRALHAGVLARSPVLDGKCWHGFGDLYEQKSLRQHGERFAELAGESYHKALAAYARVTSGRVRVDEQAIATDLAMLEIRAGDFEAAHARLDVLAEQRELSATVEARLHNRRAWAYLGQDDIMKCQRFVKKAASASSAAGDPLLMSMAEVLRLAFYEHVGMQKKSDVQYDAVLDWVYRDGIRHAEVLQPVVQRAREGDPDPRSARLGWLLRAPWLNALALVMAVAWFPGCVDSSNRLGFDSGRGDDIEFELNVDQLGSIGHAASDPKKVGSDPKRLRSDPKQVNSDPKQIASDPKKASSDPKQVNSDPKKLNSDPKTVSSDPKKTASDPKSVSSDPKSVSSDPKKLGSDPKTVGSDPKHVATTKACKNKISSDPKKPTDDDSDPKVPVKDDSDPKAPIDACA